MKNIKLKWVIAHEPAWLFYRVAKDFQRIVNENNKNFDITIEVLTAEEYNSLYQPETNLNRNNLWKALKNNTVQIAQMTTSSLGRQFNKKMQVFDLPYLFENHQHAANVLEGEIGNEILNDFDNESDLKGLAYTYSGGFRLMPVDHDISSINDLIGKSMRSGMSQISQDTIRACGMNPVPTEVEELTPTIINRAAVGGEHVAQRLIPDNCQTWTKTIIDTEHSLFLTSIVVNKSWWNNLDSDIQNLFMESAYKAAQNERQLSIEDGKQSIEKLKTTGIKYITLDQKEKNQLKLKTKSLYKKYNNEYFGSDLVFKIQNTN